MYLSFSTVLNYPEALDLITYESFKSLYPIIYESYFFFHHQNCLQNVYNFFLVIKNYISPNYKL